MENTPNPTDNTTTCARCGRTIRPNSQGGYYSYPPGHLAILCDDGIHLHRPND